MDAAPTTEAQQAADGDEALLQRCRAGDLEAFDAVVARHQDRVYSLCFWQLGDPDEAADAAQEAFIRAWKAIGRFRGDCALTTWLHRIALNVTHDAARRRGRAPLAFSALAFADEPDRAGGAEPGGEERVAREAGDAAAPWQPEHLAARRERRQAVRRALARLPEHHRAVLVLFDIQGRSYEETAALLEAPLGTVKSRLSRARLALRRELEGCRELFED